MKKEHIELLIDRLCGMFPGIHVPRNTIKSTWVNDKFLQEVSETLGKKVLLTVESDKTFPSLARIKEVFRSMLPSTGQRGCPKCGYTGFDNGITFKEDGSLDTWRYTDKNGTYIKACGCQTTVDL